MYRRFIKRFLDIVLSFSGLTILSIPMLVFMLIVKLDSPGPVFFLQKRVGLHKTTFMMPKFRTMYTETPSDMPTHLLSDPQKWITRSGRWFRRLSIDELPQIFSILTGKMSIIGPRPALWNQDDLIAERDKYGANDVRPGLTGWAQINGRDDISLVKKMKLDKEYCDNWSIAFDIKILLRSVGVCARREGYQEGKMHRR